MYIIQLTHLGNKFWLRATVWSSDITRASQYETQEAAQAALDKAKPFMKAKQYKAAVILDTRYL